MQNLPTSEKEPKFWRQSHNFDVFVLQTPPNRQVSSAPFVRGLWRALISLQQKTYISRAALIIHNQWQNFTNLFRFLNFWRGLKILWVKYLTFQKNHTSCKIYYRFKWKAPKCKYITIIKLPPKYNCLGHFYIHQFINLPPRQEK